MFYRRVARVIALNVDMGRCVYCYSVITKHEDSCYVCGDSVPNQTKVAVERRPVSGWTNTVFIASLAFTAYCFFECTQAIVAHDVSDFLHAPADQNLGRTARQQKIVN